MVKDPALIPNDGSGLVTERGGISDKNLNTIYFILENVKNKLDTMF